MNSGHLPRAWPPKPEPVHLVPTCCGECISHFLTGSFIQQQYLWWILSILPFKYMLLHSSLRFWSSPSHPWGIFQMCGIFSSFTTPCSGCKSPSPNPLSLFFFPYLLPYLILRSLACLFGSLASLPAFRRCTVGVDLHTDELFMYLHVGRWSPCPIPQLSWKSSQLYFCLLWL